MADRPQGPLSNIRVLELGSSVAGPFCGRLLADFGAEVIKVELAEGDPVRNMGKRVDGKSLYAASIFRNKKLVSIDVKAPRGRALIVALAAKSDVIVENFRPGTLERLGMGYETLSAANPGLVLVRISGFGQTVPYSQRAGYGAIGEALSGLRHLTGDPDRPPSRIAASVTDEVTAIYGAFGAMIALWSRATTGRGQVVDASLYEAAFSLIEPHVPAYDKLRVVANRAGSRLPDSAPNNLYTARDGRHIHITAMGDPVFVRLAQMIGRPGLAAEPKFANQLERSRHEDELDAMIQQWVGAHDLVEVVRALNDGGVPAAPIYTVADIFADPHYRAREMLVAAPDETLGTVTVAGVVPKLSSTPGVIRHAGRRIGADTAQVLADVLGLDAAELCALERDGVIATAAAEVRDPARTPARVNTSTASRGKRGTARGAPAPRGPKVAQ
jgi:crotonobetainyl-CoA:carnitine CoA-transferase CaiB-like acyl-CoA transferase